MELFTSLFLPVFLALNREWWEDFLHEEFVIRKSTPWPEREPTRTYLKLSSEDLIIRQEVEKREREKKPLVPPNTVSLDPPPKEIVSLSNYV